MQKLIEISTNGSGLYEFTDEVAHFVSASGVRTGLINLFVRHTSCSLMITENADPDVKTDMYEFFSRLVPENMKWLRHVCEGADDMPAHIKSALTQTSLSIPIINSNKSGRAIANLGLGTWQGIFLFEHRRHAHKRQIIATIIK